MKAFRIALALLCMLGGNAFALELPVAEGLMFRQPVDTQAVLCRGAQCSAPVTIKANTDTNCGYWVFGMASDPTFSGQCKVYAVPVTPPVVAQPFVACLPEFSLAFWNTPHDRGIVPANVSTRYTNYIVWKGKASCGGAVQSQIYTPSEVAALAAAAITDDAGLNAWIASQPITVLTAEETAFLAQKRQAFAASLVSLPPVPTPVPPAPVCRITRQSATVLDRQVYKANAAKTAVGVAVTGVRVPENTACFERLGVTNYFSVAGQKDTQGRVIAEGYAIGVLQ